MIPENFIFIRFFNKLFICQPFCFSLPLLFVPALALLKPGFQIQRSRGHKNCAQSAKQFKLNTASSFPNIVEGYYKKPMDFVVLEGAVEISVSLGVADAIVDVVETGTTLKQAGLRIVGEPLFRSNAALFCNPQKTELEEVNTLIRRIEGKLVAQSYMMIEYDCPAELLQKACELTPGLDAPTVTKLHGREWYSVKAMVPQEEANSIMDKLWDAGARSILLFGIKSARI